MNKLYFLSLSISLLLLYSCSSSEDEPAPAITCFPTSVTLSGDGTTNFEFASDGQGGQHVVKISIDPGTDSAMVYNYTYDGTKIATLTQVESDGTQTVFTATYDGDNLTKLSAPFAGSATIGQEIRFTYNNGNVIEMQIWMAPPSTGNLFQILDYTFSYSSDGNLTRSGMNFDIAAFFFIAFDQEPTDPYSPLFLGSTEFSFEQGDAPNPMRGSYFIDMPDFSFMPNLPSGMVFKDANGAETDSDTFTITLDDNGNPTSSVAASGTMRLDATYVCN